MSNFFSWPLPSAFPWQVQVHHLPSLSVISHSVTTTGVRIGETHIAEAVMADPITGHTVAAGTDTTEGGATTIPGVETVTMTIGDPLRDIMADPP